MRKQTPVILQSEAAECGLACLAMVGSHFGQDVNLRGLRTRFPASIRGYTLRRLLTVAHELGLRGRPLRADIEALDNVRLPAIMHWDLDHFVVLVSRRGGRYTLHDPARGALTYSREELSPHFTGVVVDFDPPVREATFSKPAIGLDRLLPHASGSTSLLGAIVAVTVVTQLFALASPLYVQIVIDDVLTRGNLSLLPTASLAFGGLMLFGVLVDIIRRWAVIHLGNAVGFALSRYVLSQLYRLPAGWFEKRHVGDIVSRISSVDAIREFITTSTIAVLIDIAMVALISIVLLIYSPMLTALIFGSVGLYVIALTLLYPHFKRRFADYIALSARQESFTVESIRAARVIRLNGLLHEREMQWSAIYSRVAAAGLRLGIVTIGQASVRSVIFSVQLVLIVYIGASQAVSGTGLTVGMMFAFLAYRNIVSERAAALVDRFLEFRMLDVHLDRVSDILLEGDDAIAETGDYRSVQGRITLDDVTFSYDIDSTPTFAHVNLSIAAGEYVAITGPSGAGKSTLIKLILGLEKTRFGTVKVDDTKVSVPPPEWLLGQISVVMQDDVLMSGTIADNIAFFDPDMDMARVSQVAAEAFIAAHIESLPMKYMSIIGDMGAALSAGQRQRLLLARALYRKPRILILDEGTANLDHKTEIDIAEVVSRLDITRVVVAHRPELVSRAHRVFRLEDGALIELRGDGARVHA